MKEFTVVLGSINDVKNFVNVVTKYDYEIDLTSGRYVVDAKSIMGIFSVDLSKALTLVIGTDDKTEIDRIKKAIQKFVV